MRLIVLEQFFSSRMSVRVLRRPGTPVHLLAEHGLALPDGGQPGPFIDREAMSIEVPHVEYEKLADNRLGEPSAKIRDRVGNSPGVTAVPFQGNEDHLQLRDDGNRGKGLLQGGGLSPEPPASRHETALSFRPRLPPHPQTGVVPLRTWKARKSSKPTHIAEAIQYRPRRAETYRVTSFNYRVKSRDSLTRYRPGRMVTK